MTHENRLTHNQTIPCCNDPDNQHFLLFPRCFQSLLSQMLIKTRDCKVKAKKKPLSIPDSKRKATISICSNDDHFLIDFYLTIFFPDKDECTCQRDRNRFSFWFIFYHENGI